MYFGSVRFFKHLIVVMILLLIFGLLTATICLTALNHSYKGQITDLQSETVLAQSNPLEDEEERALSIEYQEQYPEMYVKHANAYKTESKTVYLTFDDGPSDRTSEILDVLNAENIKATFFVIGKEAEVNKDILNRIVDDGHSLGIHTYSHIYNEIYASPESYLEDFHKTYTLIYETTNVKPTIFRFPGGSINSYSSLDYEEIIAEMTRRGFTYYDWNASSGDATAHASASSVLSNVIGSSAGKDRIILLMHDSASKSYTVEALPGIIQYYKEQGYQFKPITNDVSPVSFNYIDY